MCSCEVYEKALQTKGRVKRWPRYVVLPVRSSLLRALNKERLRIALRLGASLRERETERLRRSGCMEGLPMYGFRRMSVDSASNPRLSNPD